MEKIEVLKRLTFGTPVAEAEAKALMSYFVSTDQWARIFAGDIDIIFGSKGSGKSAIYLSLLNSDLLKLKHVIPIAAANPKGTPIFRELNADLNSTQEQWRELWKHYFLLLVAIHLRAQGEGDDKARWVLSELEAANLIPQETSIGSLLKSAWNYVRSIFTTKVKSLEVETGLGEAGMPSIKGKIEFDAPSAERKQKQMARVDALLKACDESLASRNAVVWLLLDRLDVAFEDSRELESAALRGLFRAYLDLQAFEHIVPKIFLRTDIWRDITASGFREGSHVVRFTELTWSLPSLLDLTVRRLLSDDRVRTFYSIARSVQVLGLDAQRAFFERVFPMRISAVTEPAATVEWIVSQTQDGSGRAAPREVIYLLNKARDQQVAVLDRGDPEPSGEALFDDASLKEAMPAVSKYRLHQTLYQEHSTLKDWIAALEGASADHSVKTLAAVWKVDEAEALIRANRMAEVGFFRPGPPAARSFQVPLLYRYALNMRTG